MLRLENIHKSVISFLLVTTLSGCVVSKKSVPVMAGEKNNFCILKSFTGKYYEGKIYVNWIVNTNISNYYFILQKAVNSEQFESICLIKGYASPSNKGLLYCYIDENAATAPAQYKLRAVQPIKNGYELILYAENKNMFEEYEHSLITVSGNNMDSASK